MGKGNDARKCAVLSPDTDTEMTGIMTGDHFCPDAVVLVEKEAALVTGGSDAEEEDSSGALADTDSEEHEVLSLYPGEVLRKRGTSLLQAWMVVVLFALCPAGAPFDRSVHTVFKYAVYKHWGALPLLLCSGVVVGCVLQLRHRGILGGEKHRRSVKRYVGLSMATALVFVIYVAVIAPHVQSLGNEWVLAACARYCRDTGPWEMCSTDYRPDPPNASGSVPYLLENVFGQCDPALPSSISGVVEGGNLVLSSSRSTAKYVVPVGAHVAIGWAYLGIPHSWIPPEPPYISNAACVWNAAAEIIKKHGGAVSAYGCSIYGKIAYLAAVTAPPGLYHKVVLDSPGALVASMRIVGPCGETMVSMQERWGDWVARDIPPVHEWEYDVGDMMHTCGNTSFLFTVAKDDLWNNPSGLLETVRKGRAFGCNVQLMETKTEHCLQPWKSSPFPHDYDWQ
eukprot:Hpha_TRINITY_DN13320_c0_g1::TRINITY_DN13320_c0_g1_i1::g.95306::m.95306